MKLGVHTGPQDLEMEELLRIWVGGAGPRRTPELAARYADGFNVPYLGPEHYAERIATLDRCCEERGRDPREIERSVNVGFYMGAGAAGADRKHDVEHIGGPGMLVGTPQQAVDRIGAYELAGAQGLNIAFRPPVDWDAYEAFLEEVVPHFQE